MRELVAKFVDESIDEVFVGKHAQIKEFVKNHERKDVLIDRLCHQFNIAAKTKYRTKLTREKIKEVVTSFVQFFGDLAKVEADSHNKKYNINLMNEFNKQLRKGDQVKDEDIRTRIDSLD